MGNIMSEISLFILIICIVIGNIALYLFLKKKEQGFPPEILNQIVQLNEKIGQQSQINSQQAQAIQDIKSKVLLSSQLQDHLKNGIEKTRDILEDLKKNAQAREEKEKELIDFKIAIEKARQWSYQNSGKIPIGLFYRQKFPTFEEKV